MATRKATSMPVNTVNSEAEDSTLKRRARRRLIGAIALALLAVILLPMLFDAEKKPLDADISIQIPNKDAVVTKGPGAIVIPGAPGAVLSAPPDVKGDAKADAKGGAGAAAQSTAEPQEGAKAGAKGGAKAEPKTEPKAEPKADSKIDAKAEPKPPAAKPDDKRSAKDVAEEKRAAAILNAQAEAAKASAALSGKATAAEGGFAVQVGAFAAADKVQEARDKLGAAGIKTYTEKLDTKDGERTRVRAGPFAAKDAAEAAREQIKTLGFSGAAVVSR